MAASGVGFRQIIAGPRYVVCNVQSSFVLVIRGGGSQPVVGGGSLLCFLLVFLRVTPLCGVTLLISSGLRGAR